MSIYPKIESEDIRRLFPDWQKIKPGEWSATEHSIKYGNERDSKNMLKLYRVGEKSEEYGKYQIFVVSPDYSAESNSTGEVWFYDIVD